MSKERYGECSKRKCKWIGTDAEKSRIPDKNFPTFAESLVCPKCGNDSFYELEGEKIKNHLAKKEKELSEIDNPNYKNYRKKTIQQMRPYIPGEDLTGVSVSKEDTPELGGMIAIGADNQALWYVSKRFYEENYELVD